jgi:ABC-type phosphate/phosphonate transport system substrate-binding protein
VEGLADLKGSRYLLNSPVSNSGMNLPRRSLAEMAGGGRLFSAVIETGGHPASLDRLPRGDGDVASIDCVTYAFWRHYRPDAAARVRIIGETPRSPAIPFVTSIATPPAVVQILRTALRVLMHDARYENVRSGMLLTDVVDLPDTAYRGLLDYEREARELGYAVVA